MTKLENEIVINASLEKIWGLLAAPADLDKFDPTVKKSTLISNEKTGLGAKRKVEMLDGKNWFEDKITVYDPSKILGYQLTNCSFPMKSLKFTYTFEKVGEEIKVKQEMVYVVKFGFLGKMMDSMMIRKQSNIGIRKFFVGLKDYAEKN